MTAPESLARVRELIALAKGSRYYWLELKVRGLTGFIGLSPVWWK